MNFYTLFSGLIFL